MKPDIANLCTLCPGIDETLVAAHVDRLPDFYFEAFSEKTIARHVNEISLLSSQNPVTILIEKTSSGNIGCTIVGFDYPFAFSLITGIMGGLGFSIQQGRAFTYAKAGYRASRHMHRRRYLRQRLIEENFQRKKIIDYFSGYLVQPFSYHTWKRVFETTTRSVFSLLEHGDPASVSQAKITVNELVVNYLREAEPDLGEVLYPVRIEVDNTTGLFTRMNVYSDDTPFFLYTLGTAFSLHNITIENVHISTENKHVADLFDLVDGSGKKIDNPELLSRIKLSVLLTKQFTYFLGRAPNPYAALARFEQLVEDLVKKPEGGRFIEMLSRPRIMQDLAQLFGASDFLWEDFIRLQYEELLPLIGSAEKQADFLEPVETVYWRLDEYIKDAKDFTEKIERINAFKDREIFQIDLDHIINHRTDIKILSEKLTILAEIVINVTANLVYRDLSERFGVPRTVAGLEANYAILGLGKFGGAALGYASDIELLFVYNDNGVTDGERRVENAEFFNMFVKEVSRAIRTKREGIFTVDLQLRPYGKDGPFSCSLNMFCQYYGKGGGAHSYERLALVRLRALGGDRDLGLQVERIRDDMIYASPEIDLREFRSLREKQLAEKSEPGKVNAKFSPGALVDLEYTVQLMQVTHGRDMTSLRTPRIHRALTELTKAGVLDEDECNELTDSYDFLRHLINGLRMLRGSARDLFLPPSDSVEFEHLARRLGYVKEKGLTPAKRLDLDFAARTAVVRRFIERHFGRDSIPGTAVGNVADIVLSESVPEELAVKILSGYRFLNNRRAHNNLQKLAGDGRQRECFAKLALLACDMLRTAPDPDMALNNWERFVVSLSNAYSHYEMLLSQPMRLDILLKIFSGSQFLANTLITNPHFFDWVTEPEHIQLLLDRGETESKLREIAERAADHRAWLNGLRNLKKREILRIGTRDICIHVPVEEIVQELSTLAEASIQIVLERNLLMHRYSNNQNRGQDPISSFCILALGKLGGMELNYSSDIDLIGIYDETADGNCGDSSEVSCETFYSSLLSMVRSDLSDHTEEGYAYRVDLRLRPFGRSGLLVYSLQNLERYYRTQASLWELQALLKIRPVAGNREIGHAFINNIQPLLVHPFKKEAVVHNIEKMRSSAVKQLFKRISSAGDDIKIGPGGIRDIEFLVQGLQLIHMHAYPDLLSGNTLDALSRLSARHLVAEKKAEQLRDDYIFLRRIEHVLQIYEDRQIHALPNSETEIDALAKRILGTEENHASFRQRLDACRSRVSTAYTDLLIES